MNTFFLLLGPITIFASIAMAYMPDSLMERAKQAGYCGQQAERPQ